VGASIEFEAADAFVQVGRDRIAPGDVLVDVGQSR
jgi:hypothetical protein